MATMDSVLPTSSDTPVQERNNARWFGQHEFVATLIGIVLYVAIVWFTSFAALAESFGIDLRPGIVVPIIFGFVYGPGVGFLIGTLGNLTSDYMMWQAVYWQWSVGVGIMGLIPGLYALRWRSYHSVREQIIAFFVMVSGIVLGMGFASLSSVVICQPDVNLGYCDSRPVTLEMARSSFSSAAWVNFFNATIMVPLLLFNIERLDLRAIDWRASGLLRRILFAIAISAALPIALLGFFLTQQFTGQNVDTGSLTVRLLATIIVTLLFTVANAALVAQALTRPLVRLTNAAKAMENNTLSEEDARALQEATEDDEIGNLSRIFGRMAGEVIQRENRLRKQVEELQIQIDVEKKSAAVAEITDNEFFRELKQKSRNLRNKRAGTDEET